MTETMVDQSQMTNRRVKALNEIAPRLVRAGSRWHPHSLFRVHHLFRMDVSNPCNTVLFNANDTFSRRRRW
jgi:hypothetical protein